MGLSLCSFILRHIPRRSPTHNAVYFTTTRLGGYTLLTSEQVKEATKLNDIGHLFHYPSAPNADSFDVNIIVGLARADFSGKDIDMFTCCIRLSPTIILTRNQNNGTAVSVKRLTGSMVLILNM